MTEAGGKRRANGPGLNMARAQVWFPGDGIRDSAWHTVTEECLLKKVLDRDGPRRNDKQQAP